MRAQPLRVAIVTREPEAGRHFETELVAIEQFGRNAALPQGDDYMSTESALSDTGKAEEQNDRCAE